MERSRAVLAKLDEIELEMRRIGFWDDGLDVSLIHERATAHTREQHRSPATIMPFEHWLQAVFVPSARHAALTNALPASSQVGLMAMRQYDYHSHVPEAQRLLALLHEFDSLI